MNKISLGELERKMIRTSAWTLAPRTVYDSALTSSKKGISTGIGFDDRVGWYILCTAGQGPCLDYCERNRELIQEQQ
jgi:hypothetical protein